MGIYSCGTSISPWVVTLDALEEAGAVIDVEAGRFPGGKWTKQSFLSRSGDVSVNLKNLHWSPFQMVAHQSSAGCGLRSGDLLGTGTLSSTEQQASEDSVPPGTGRSGCLQEAMKNAKHPLLLESGENLSWIEDGDKVVMEAWAGSDGSKIGFGELSARVHPAKKQIW
ncbi:2-keto-4-pentenoate hydratase 2-oxohepta-3-ene- -dioic acid hydratase [Colletotrichum incanum]|uniref:Fumarylacetoacetase n=1 Tax=Colletotrichum incanum TaxID=1573173 RepID=A0A161WIB9_COLIC|nr:2-keto-4-pentenoate hydratase 2-oxohepta-3-ene- -dioic acid hydratase [Colletotrichum incanum]